VAGIGLTWRRDWEDARIVFWPLGSYEQHGPHLPYETDTLIAVEVAARAAEAFGAPVVAPLAIGVSPEHMGFKGTVSLGVNVFCDVLRSVWSSLRHHGVELVVVVNGHGGNRGALAACASEWNALRRPPRVLDYWVWEGVDMRGDKHAGPVESSVVAAILGLDRVSARGRDCEGVFTLLRVDECSETGVVYPGEFTAYPAEGHAIIEMIVERLKDRVCGAAGALGLRIPQCGRATT